MEKIKFEDVEVGDTICHVVESDKYTSELQFVVEYRSNGPNRGNCLGNYSVDKDLGICVADDSPDHPKGTLYLVKKRAKRAAEFPVATTIITRTNHKNDTRSYVKTAVKVAENQWFMMTDGEWHSVGKNETIDNYELKEKDVKILLPDGTELQPNKG